MLPLYHRIPALARIGVDGQTLKQLRGAPAWPVNLRECRLGPASQPALAARQYTLSSR